MAFKKISFNYLPSPPQKSELQNDKLEKAILYLLIIVAIIVALGDFVLAPNVNLFIMELIVLIILILAFITRPINVKIYDVNYTSITEKIMNRFSS